MFYGAGLVQLPIREEPKIEIRLIEALANDFHSLIATVLTLTAFGPNLSNGVLFS